MASGLKVILVSDRAQCTAVRVTLSVAALDRWRSLPLRTVAKSRICAYL